MKVMRREYYLTAHRMGALGILLLVLGLVGCGGGGNEGGANGGNNSPLPPSPATQVQVVDGFGVAKPNARTWLDLSAFVRGHGAQVTSLSSEQQGCEAGAINGLTAEVDIREETFCLYRFSASSGGSAAVGTLSVLATQAATPVLEPLSQAMTLSQGAKTFDLMALFGAAWPAGYQLKTNSVLVQGGTAQGSVISNGNNVTYTPPLTPDWNRILFTLENSTLPGEDILGSLYVTVSESVNQAPIINQSKYDYSATVNSNHAIEAFENATLDLSSLNNLTIADPEGKPWQLIEVQSYSATVKSAAANDVTNKKFTFQAGTPGEHIVSYIVGDHEGGYRMGMMRVYVDVKEHPKTWTNIDLVTPSLRFYAPPRYSELKSTVSPEYIIEPAWDNAVNNGSGNTLGAAGSMAATAYCSGKRLPKQADMELLRAVTGSEATQLAQYPHGRPYLITDDSGSIFQTYNLTTGVMSNYSPGVTVNPYIICVSDHGMSYSANPDTPFAGMTNTLLSDDEWHILGVVTSQSGTTSNSPTLFGTPSNVGSVNLAAANFRLNPAQCASNPCYLEAKGTGYEYGSATAQITNAVMTAKSLTVPVTFLKNAKVTAMSVTTDNALANNVDSNVITLTLKDSLDNFVPIGTEVKISYTAILKPTFNNVLRPGYTPASGSFVTVGNDGEVKLSIKSNYSVGTVEIKDVKVTGGLPSDVTSSAIITFVSPTVVHSKFTKPATQARTWDAAYTYCQGLGARLPSIGELEQLYLDSTQATVLASGPQNFDMCGLYGWPLGMAGNACGGITSYYWTTGGSAIGHWVVALNSGASIATTDSATRQVTCIR